MRNDASVSIHIRVTPSENIVTKLQTSKYPENAAFHAKIFILTEYYSEEADRQKRAPHEH